VGETGSGKFSCQAPNQYQLKPARSISPLPFIASYQSPRDTLRIIIEERLGESGGLSIELSTALSQSSAPDWGSYSHDLEAGEAALEPNVKLYARRLLLLSLRVSASAFTSKYTSRGPLQVVRDFLDPSSDALKTLSDGDFHQNINKLPASYSGTNWNLSHSPKFQITVREAPVNCFQS